MSILNKFCCGCRSRSTSLVTAFYSIFMAVTCMSLMLLQNSTKKRQGQNRDVPAMSYISLAVYSLLIVFSFVLIAGANLGRLCVFVPWVLNMLAVLSFEATALGIEYPISLRNPVKLRSWDAFYISFYVVRTLCNVYFTVSVTVQCLCSLRPDGEDDGTDSNKDIYESPGALDMVVGDHSPEGACGLPESLSQEYDPMLLEPLHCQDAEVIFNENATWDDISVEEKKTLIDSDLEEEKYNIVDNMDIEIG